MQILTQPLRLRHEAVPIDTGLGYSRAGSTHSPDAALTHLHYHDSLEIGYCYGGSGVFIIDNKILPFSEGAASIIFPHEIHIARSSRDHESHWKFINIDPAVLLGRSNPDAAFLFPAENPGIRGIVDAGDACGLNVLVRELVEESGRADGEGRLAMRGLALCLCARMLRTAPGAGPAGRRAQGSVRRISAALDLVLNHYARPIYISEMAAACGMGENAFRRAFTRAMGVAPNHYIQAFRIQMAAMQLLCSTLSILDIAYAVGYDTLSGFNRHFKNAMGVSPREYRRGATRE